jgi:hypothetical protein
MKGLVAIATMTSSACATAQTSSIATICATPTAADERWLSASLTAWELTRADILRVPPAEERPTMVFYDAACGYRGDGAHGWIGAAHNGAVALPDGQSLPPQVASFAAPYDHDRHAFFAMALPSVWRAGGVESELGLETLMTGVLVHEMTHTRQFYFFAPRLAQLTAQYQLPDDLDDDVVQTRFEATPEFAADISEERDLLFAAAASPDDATARDLARRALQRMQARQAAYYVGEDVKYRALEDVFLTLEGLAQWASYRWLTDPRGGAHADDAATLTAFRRGGRRWSQDEGLALFLVIDRLVPDWRERAFAARPATALELLALAAR